MGTALVAATLGAAVGWIRRDVPVPSARLRGVSLLLAAFLLQAAAITPVLPAAAARADALMASYAVTGLFVVRNLRVPGLPWIAVGGLLNATVIAANGGMPVSSEAAAAAGLDADRLAVAPVARHLMLSDSSRLPWLADILPVPLPLRPEVISVGDLLTAVGLGVLTAAWVRVPPWSSDLTIGQSHLTVGHPTIGRREATVAKKSRKRRARAKSKANHGKRPNA